MRDPIPVRTAHHHQRVPLAQFDRHKNQPLYSAMGVQLLDARI